MTDFDDWFDREVETGISYSDNVFGSLALFSDRMEGYLRGVIRSAFEAGREDTIPRAEAEAMVAAVHLECQLAVQDFTSKDFNDERGEYETTFADDHIRAVVLEADASAALDKMLAEAVAKERERCARIADQWATDQQREFGNGGPATAIRKGDG